MCGGYPFTSMNVFGAFRLRLYKSVQAKPVDVYSALNSFHFYVEEAVDGSCFQADAYLIYLISRLFFERSLGV